MSLHIPVPGSPAQRLLLEKALPQLPGPQEVFLPLIHRLRLRKETAFPWGHTESGCWGQDLNLGSLSVGKARVPQPRPSKGITHWLQVALHVINFL